MRARQHGLQIVGAQHRETAARLKRAQKLATLAHLGAAERLEHRRGFRPSHRDRKSGMFDPDARGRGHFGPDLPRPHRPLPALAALLPGDGDETEIADRGAVRPCIALDDHDPQAAAHARKRVGQTTDAATDHG